MHSPSASQSEGEYRSSDSETKATKPPSFRSDNRVNRLSRPRYDNRPQPQPRRSRSRSRSPYRASRGEKRRREDDHRTFKIRYEDVKSVRHNHHTDHRSKRSRTYSRSRSRSPYRHDKLPPRLHRESSNNTNSESVSTQDLKSERVPLQETYAKTEMQNRAKERSIVSDKINPSTTAELDAAALIEARRKRREAIKNQHRSDVPSLLVQALGGLPDGSANSLNTTPNRSVSPTPAPISEPTTPGPTERSAPDSPMASIAKDLDMVDDDMFGSPRRGDEPSAADYDPTADMQDERARHDKRLFKEDEASEALAKLQVLQQSEKTMQDPPVLEKNAEFDMFAEEDDNDDDMFATVPSRQPKAAASSAKKLDEAMMDNWDDAEGYYLTNLHENIDDRYEVTANLGRGMFASVVRAMDTKSKKPVAIKIIRNNESMRKAGLKEVDILKDLAANDPDDRKHVVRLLRSFEHKGHLCMVFENLDMNLREVLKKFGRDIGLNIKAIRAYAQQLFLGLSLLHETRTKIKIADLGSASPITENATAPYLVSRFYRAPEVILGIDYDYGIDMWSTGCTLFELYTGKILFTGRNNNNMLKNIMECRGKFPHKLLRKGTLSYEYFDDLLNFKSQEQDKTTGRIVTKIMDIKAKPIRDLRSRLIPKDKRLGESERKELELFADLLDKCLDLRVDKRITPAEALKHPFIMRTK